MSKATVKVINLKAKKFRFTKCTLHTVSVLMQPNVSALHMEWLVLCNAKLK